MNTTFSSTAIILFLIGASALAFCVYAFIKKRKTARFKEKMNELYETISVNSRNMAFGGGKKEFYSVGNMLGKLFPNEDLKELFIKYVNLHKTYTTFSSDIYKGLKYAKDTYKEFDEEECYSLLALVMLQVDGIKRYDDCSIERIEPFRRNAKSVIKSVETIAANEETFGTKSEKRLGTRENPILVAGANGIKEYFTALYAEDGTSLDYIHKSTVYIRDKELNIEYDLRKYSLIDADTGAEIRTLWFNSYGIDNYKQCIEGFVFRKDIPKNCISLNQCDTADGTCGLSIPVNVTASNVSTNGLPKITWSKVEGANKYFIYRSTSKDGVYTYQGSSIDTCHINSSADPGVCYYYKIKAADTANKFVKSQYSKECSVTCDLEQPVINVTLRSEKPFVSWEAISGASKYDLYRKVGEKGSYDKLYSTVGTSVANVSATEGKTYYYKVMAICPISSQGNSAYSDEVSITI